MNARFLMKAAGKICKMFFFRTIIFTGSFWHLSFGFPNSKLFPTELHMDPYNHKQQAWLVCSNWNTNKTRCSKKKNILTRQQQQQYYSGCVTMNVAWSVIAAIKTALLCYIVAKPSYNNISTCYRVHNSTRSNTQIFVTAVIMQKAIHFNPKLHGQYIINNCGRKENCSNSYLSITKLFLQQNEKASDTSAVYYLIEKLTTFRILLDVI